MDALLKRIVVFGMLSAILSAIAYGSPCRLIVQASDTWGNEIDLGAAQIELSRRQDSVTGIDRIPWRESYDIDCGQYILSVIVDNFRKLSVPIDIQGEKTVKLGLAANLHVQMLNPHIGVDVRSKDYAARDSSSWKLVSVFGTFSYTDLGTTHGRAEFQYVEPGLYCLIRLDKSSVKWSYCFPVTYETRRFEVSAGEDSKILVTVAGRGPLTREFR